jgi:hypothetical protein
MLKIGIPVLFVLGAVLVLYNVIPTEITVVLWLILITLTINKWDVLKKQFS